MAFFFFFFLETELLYWVAALELLISCLPLPMLGSQVGITIPCSLPQQRSVFALSDRDQNTSTHGGTVLGLRRQAWPEDFPELGYPVYGTATLGETQMLLHLIKIHDDAFSALYTL